MSGHRWVRWAVALLVVVFAGVALLTQWSRVRDHIAELSAPSVALAALAVLVGTFASMLGWRALLADLGSPLPLPVAIRIFFLGQLGKYLPGSVWSVVTQMELGRAYHVPRARSGTATLVMTALAIVSGVVVAAVTLPVVAAAQARGYAVLLVVVPLLLVLLHPRVLARVLDRVLRLARRTPLERSPSWRGIAAGAGWFTVTWVCFGVQAWLLAHDLGGSGGRLLPLATGAFAVSWTAGFLFVVAPAGLGVREAGLVAFLGGTLGTPAATLLAVVSRLLLTVGDLVWALLAVAVVRRHRRRGTGAAG